MLLCDWLACACPARLSAIPAAAISDQRRIVTSSRYNDLVRMDRQRGHGADCQRENDGSEDEYCHAQPPVIGSARTVLLPTCTVFGSYWSRCDRSH